MMQKIFSSLRQPSSELKLAIVIFFALIVGSIYVSYHFEATKTLSAQGEVYWPVTPQNEAGILSVFYDRIREYVDGYRIIGDIDLYEYRQGPLSTHPPIPAIIYFGIYLLVGLHFMVYVADFLLPAIIFILIFYLCETVLDRFWPSVVAAFFLITTDVVLPYRILPTSIIEFKELIKLLSPIVLGSGHIPRMRFMSVESIKPAFIVFIPFLLVLLKSFKEPKHWRVSLGLGILFGLLFYTYPLYWLFGGMMIGLLWLWYAFRRQWSPLIWLSVAGGIGLAISSYFWVMFYQLHHLPQYQDVFSRATASDFGHFFRWSQWPWYLVSLGLILILNQWSKANGRRHIFKFISLFLVVGLVALNLQLLTGSNPSPDHWYTKLLFIPLYLSEWIMGLWLFDQFSSRYIRLSRYGQILFGIIAVIIIVGAYNSEQAIARHEAVSHRMPIGTAKALVWIDANIPKDSVFISPSFYIYELIPYFTSSRIFVPMVWNTAISSEEIRERLFIALKLSMVSTEQFRNLFNELTPIDWNPGSFPINRPEPVNYVFGFGDNSVNHIVYGDMLSSSFIPSRVVLSTAERERLAQTYDEYRLDFRTVVSKYRMDYLLLDNFGQQVSSVGLKNQPYLKKVYDQDNVIIYQINQSRL